MNRLRNRSHMQTNMHSLEHTHTRHPHVHPHTHSYTHTRCVTGLLSASEVGLLDTPQMDDLYSVQQKSLSVSLKAKSRVNQ